MMFRSHAKVSLFVAMLLTSTFPAAAHVTIDKREAAPGTFYKAVFSVPHGCGESTTVRLQVKIPEGILMVKPMVKPAWQVAVTRAAYSKPFSALHGAKFTEGVSEVTWSGELPNALYDEFVLTTFISSDLSPGTTLYFPVIQTCEKGEHRWIEIPTGKPDEHLSEPAPALKLVPQGARP
jgi:uncharacterized protein YcnI